MGFSPGIAEENDPSKGLCTGKFAFAETEARYDDFDFWLGDWFVVDTESGQLRGFDKITKELNGCSVKQNIVTLDDQFSIGKTDWRLTGTSYSGIKTGGEWRQVWLDNAGNNFTLTGKRHSDGTFIFNSEKLTWSANGQSNSVQYRWYWKEGKNGTVRNWGFWLDKNGNETGKLFDVTYYPNKQGTRPFLMAPKS